MLPARHHVGRSPVHANVPRHREHLQVNGRHRAAFLIRYECVAREAFGFGPGAGGERPKSAKAAG
jgi:hypothetical protein